MVWLSKNCDLPLREPGHPLLSLISPLAVDTSTVVSEHSLSLPLPSVPVFAGFSLRFVDVPFSRLG